jgi:hypothetical protein
VHTNKESVRVVVVTAYHRIEGNMFVLPGSRLTDALNSKAKDFLAVTDAKVWSLADAKLLYEPSYLALNRSSIDAIFPLE